jgi:hypothetical protein
MQLTNDMGYNCIILCARIIYACSIALDVTKSEMKITNYSVLIILHPSGLIFKAEGTPVPLGLKPNIWNFETSAAIIRIITITLTSSSS